MRIYNDFIEFVYNGEFYIYRKDPKESFNNWYRSKVDDYIWDAISDDRPIVSELKCHLKQLIRKEKMKRIEL